jgi:hypothetical protein
VVGEATGVVTSLMGSPASPVPPQAAVEARDKRRRREMANFSGLSFEFEGIGAWVPV